MTKIIQDRLKQIELDYDVKILFAVESGSRAWGFPSKDSDWDVRFIYIMRPPRYATVHTPKDTIEIMDREKDLDFAGWELRKALGLLYKGNPPLMEWLKSPIVYTADEEFVTELKQLASLYYEPQSAIYHYIHMAGGNYDNYIKDRDMVEVKKYLYMFRPLLACLYIQDKGVFPPIEIDKTLQYLDKTVDLRFNDLLSLKKAGVELGTMPTDQDFNKWIVAHLEHFRAYVKTLDKKPKDSIPLDRFLFKWIWQAWE